MASLKVLKIDEIISSVFASFIELKSRANPIDKSPKGSAVALNISINLTAIIGV